MKKQNTNKFGAAMSIPKGNGQNGGKPPKQIKPLCDKKCNNKCNKGGKK